jgi:hypothetical protein
VRPRRPITALLVVVLTAGFALVGGPRRAASDGGPERLRGSELSTRGRASLRARPPAPSRVRATVGAAAPDVVVSGPLGACEVPRVAALVVTPPPPAAPGGDTALPARSRGPPRG